MIWRDIWREGYFLLRKKSVLLLLLSALGLSVFSVWTGSQEVAAQQATIARLLEADALDRADVLQQQNDYGGVAYYSFHLTYAPPSPLAFAALGARDVYPWKHRIRMLALEGQIYESDTGNPELAQAGRIDFAFVISVLAPVFIILLLHDLRASERAAGRDDLLNVTAHSRRALWPLRAGIIVALLSGVLLLPFWFGAFAHSVPCWQVATVTLVCICYMALIALLCYWVSGWLYPAPVLASMLLGIWLLTTYIIPALGNEAIEHSIDGPLGGDILMVQREAVNGAWELPYSHTMDEFVKTHPKWADYTEMSALFEWKWYFAFHQVGDQVAAPLSKRYREVGKKKYQMAGVVAWLSPATLLQRTLTRLAQTDAIAAREYEQQVRDFHEQLRHFYYPLLFTSPPFHRDVFKARPTFEPIEYTK
ncbi:DUF3526 domain-containing protein [Alteromonas sp. C1M14]|uniref:DUF3526 domain-containing protein n=1 Tax=Alteromonas sp. C1M14 TaxID=2841567 RepID=UPI001C088BB7|nr:DUF3526 domain-containing protein [Alteromonas sp. C1M14]MBU2979999.1 DUF3526 domain-containing protein [Alteromonas sp. C1M14]